MDGLADRSHHSGYSFGARGCHCQSDSHGHRSQLDDPLWQLSNTLQFLLLGCRCQLHQHVARPDGRIRGQFGTYRWSGGGPSVQSRGRIVERCRSRLTEECCLCDRRESGDCCCASRQRLSAERIDRSTPVNRSDQSGRSPTPAEK